MPFRVIEYDALLTEINQIALVYREKDMEPGSPVNARIYELRALGYPYHSNIPLKTSRTKYSNNAIFIDSSALWESEAAPWCNKMCFINEDSNRAKSLARTLGQEYFDEFRPDFPRVGVPDKRFTFQQQGRIYAAHGHEVRKVRFGLEVDEQAAGVLAKPLE
jgi:hypothetical protein